MKKLNRKVDAKDISESKAPIPWDSHDYTKSKPWASRKNHMPYEAAIQCEGDERGFLVCWTAAQPVKSKFAVIERKCAAMRRTYPANPLS